MKLYQVGGHVRDSLLGQKSHDVDYSVGANSFEEMHEFVKTISKQIFLVKPEYLTIRASNLSGEVADYVLCRKEGTYTDGRRPDSVQAGTILDDLARRDFTINAMAIDCDTGKLLDPFGGEQDLRDRVLRCVGNTSDRFNEDSLRILRAMRFYITKGLYLSPEILEVFGNPDYWVSSLSVISMERKREELHKCFSFDTVATLDFFRSVPRVWAEILFKDLWLKPTNEKR